MRYRIDHFDVNKVGGPDVDLTDRRVILQDTRDDKIVQVVATRLVAIKVTCCDHRLLEISIERHVCGAVRID